MTKERLSRLMCVQDAVLIVGIFGQPEASMSQGESQHPAGRDGDPSFDENFERAAARNPACSAECVRGVNAEPDRRQTAGRALGRHPPSTGRQPGRFVLRLRSVPGDGATRRGSRSDRPPRCCSRPKEAWDGSASDRGLRSSRARSRFGRWVRFLEGGVSGFRGSSWARCAWRPIRYIMST